MNEDSIDKRDATSHRLLRIAIAASSACLWVWLLTTVCLNVGRHIWIMSLNWSGKPMFMLASLFVAMCGIILIVTRVYAQNFRPECVIVVALVAIIEQVKIHLAPALDVSTRGLIMVGLVSAIPVIGTVADSLFKVILPVRIRGLASGLVWYTISVIAIIQIINIASASSLASRGKVDEREFLLIWLVDIAVVVTAVAIQVARELKWLPRVREAKGASFFS